MGNQEDYLLQSVKLIRQGAGPAALDLSFMRQVVYVETIDLSGPRLILTLDDPHSIIRDEMKVKPRDVLEVRIADAWMRDGIDQVIKFTIWTMPNQGNAVTLNCMETHVDLLKQPAPSTILFSRKPVETIVKRLAPGLKYDLGSFPVTDDYHLLPGERPSRLLRQMAKEKGAVCFFRRGSAVFKKLADLAKQKVLHTYEHENPSAPNQVIHFTRPNTKAVIKDRVERNLIGWNMEKGIVKSGKMADKPPELVSITTGMDNLLEIPFPAIDFTTHGNGALMPGAPLSLVWNIYKTDAPIDESLPAKVVISTVAHFYSNQKYFCRVKGVLPK